MHCEGRVKLALAVLFGALAAGCGNSHTASATATAAAPAAGFALQSSAFHAGGTIPRRYTCDGHNTQPPLRWTKPPAGTKGMALAVDDPDAPSGRFTHWTLVGLPARAGALPAPLRL